MIFKSWEERQARQCARGNHQMGGPFGWSASTEEQFKQPGPPSPFFGWGTQVYCCVHCGAEELRTVKVAW